MKEDLDEYVSFLIVRAYACKIVLQQHALLGGLEL